jgi:hypothetical protein
MRRHATAKGYSKASRMRAVALVESRKKRPSGGTHLNLGVSTTIR